jgi:hypothetical protein
LDDTPVPFRVGHRGKAVGGQQQASQQQDPVARLPCRAGVHRVGHVSSSDRDISKGKL